MKYIIALLFLLIAHNAISQSETNNFITYDSAVTYRYDQWHTTTYYLRISRPVNLFTAGNPDTASRPGLFFMPGIGEMNSNPASLVKWGAHYWLNQGWNGGIQLSNGIHFPIYITLACAVSIPPISGNFWVLDYCIKTYHIKRNSVHISGLSEGAFTWAGMLGITDTIGTGTTGADIGMREVTSMALLSGAATSTGNYNIFGHWAKKYNGRAFLTVGFNDAQIINPPLLAAQMQDSVPGSVYYTYNTVDGGAHGLWDTVYSPYQTNWNALAPMGKYITASPQGNLQGTYKNGWNLFQWMLRQGDTTLVGGSTTAPACPPARTATNIQVLLLGTWIALPAGSAKLIYNDGTTQQY
jgi:hypothetical protein